ncbi:SDR family NAD(P)-dependent oxidoreductase [Chitinasiproducens palmae]|uniref:NAD(P)-dependent dehydrogenase, short-chain alcohol dehydrogenase family n=1 Tax=Chitinasiproducens palmae TaxID=1770053 RepID=A0A1H2PTF4_9BURK|nr:SDR family NAD(P)-dependent oxidoreductase [Chitinasiproducens palmae]SDV50373.1 NAD(P)-dependent dehydrogenase, short-chain alcohol dehydrogenase family [Chitinasiproducens palmae]
MAVIFRDRAPDALNEGSPTAERSRAAASGAQQPAGPAARTRGRAAAGETARREGGATAQPRRTTAARSAERRVALVTGGAAGIGAAIAARLATDCDVIIADRDEEAAQRCAARLNGRRRNVAALAMDAGDADSIAAVCARIAAEWGRCDILVNNAGIAKTYPFTDYPTDHWQAVLDVNLTGPLLLAQTLVPLMRKQRWGRIVNVASISGIRASAGRTAYGTSKAAVMGLTRQMAIELAGEGITANAVAPGPIETPMTSALHSTQTRDGYLRAVPMRRYGRPEEIAAAVAFLASDDASYITGHTLPVDGGYLAAGLLDI